VPLLFRVRTPVATVLRMQRGALLGVALLLLVAGCQASRADLPGSDETDRIAQVVSDAIGYPTQDSAMDYARAAADTTAGQDGRLAVVDVEELEADDRTEPFARLTYRIHLEAQNAGWIADEPVTACYLADFGSYGLADPPERVACPAGARPVDIPPFTPEPVAEVPDGFDRVLDRALAAAVPDAVALHKEIGTALRRAGRPPLPRLDVAVDGTDAGVAVSGEGECLLGARVDGRVEVWSPSAVQIQPGELSCDARTALGRLGQQPPH
jgi:hypothetical protein